MEHEVKDAHGNMIHEGDKVETKIRGGKHEGTVSRKYYYLFGHWIEFCFLGLALVTDFSILKVERIVTTKDEAEEEGVKNPPKVIIVIFR